ncbi:four-carbon acid sugar kinase family protein [Methylocapsa sp. S129]|uniref:four-carbon acid sugar kinase family protein n=1 Tax=Methylocapsa sp. S129 TaxID=1641869 RepID=UPI00131B3DED|nr:four-carbon acid sugar kinase family protein [Methylocapsa sp. S129]
MSPLLLSYYGDDLTGSTDVMEALESRGVSTVLFMQPPNEAQRSRFKRARAIGLAGSSRSETPAWMDEHLNVAFAWLKSLEAAICHYKVCSTFDSSPEIGSIGRAIDIGQSLFAQAHVPLVVGAPQLKRYTAFGNLFAAYRDAVYRIDRHPVMSRHPVTPMKEADLRLHLAQQTAKRIGLVDLAALNDANVDRLVDKALSDDSEIVMFDVADLATQRSVGRQIWRMRKDDSLFVVGSSGVEYALLSEWADAGLIDGEPSFSAAGPVDRIAVVSGSCSPTTERQIRHAIANGFDGVALDPRELASGEAAPISNAIERGLPSLAAGRSVILYTALGPSSDVGGELEGQESARRAIGRGLGQIQRALIAQARLTRAVIAGGDTSSHALGELGIFALTIKMPLRATPGSPLCAAHSNDPAFDGMEIALKGGQIGGDDYFGKIRDGTS